jgi:C4-dicarboxylate-specific signal transduction histidine kinase
MSDASLDALSAGPNIGVDVLTAVVGNGLGNSSGGVAAAGHQQVGHGGDGSLRARRPARRESGNSPGNFDLTERKRAEAEIRDSERRYRDSLAELAHANRVATMGQLAASIAHEVKQPVAAAVINAEAALHFLGLAPPQLERVRQSLNAIVVTGHRAGDVVDRIRALIKKEPARNESLDANETIRQVCELSYGEAIKNGVSAQMDLADDLPFVRGDRVQLQQVILNLIMNAIEAMSEVDEGVRTLLIRTRKTETDGVLVSVHDSGPGLAPSSLKRAFDAFYTTKPNGMGMGLSICRSIIEAHGGQLWASAHEPRGAAFTFVLPAAGIETIAASGIPTA